MAQTVYCPKCGSEMKLRTAQRGKFAGHQFYGCTRYPDCNGIVNIDVQSSQDSAIDNRPYIDTSSLNFPIRLTARSRSPGFKAVFLDTIAVPQRILNAANHYSILHNVITNAAKWRLDFTPPDNYQPSNLVNAQISILEKIINRGRITRLSENLETEILNLSDNQLQYSVSSITHTYANYHTPNIPNQWTDGKKRAEFGNMTAEEYFYKNILLKIIGESNIKDILPQVYFSSLVINRGTLQTASLSQRVDFLISHNGQAIVVEIDDSTHSNHQAKDMERDKILELNGLDSYRIPIDELISGQGSNLSSLKQRLSTIYKTAQQTNPSDIHTDLLSVRLAQQFQLITIELLKYGKIKPGQRTKIYFKPENIPHLSPKTISRILESSLRDLAELDKAVASIYRTTTLLGKIILTSDSPDLVISVNDDYTYTPDQMVYMQDISFPLQIDQNNWVDLRYDMNLASDEKALRFILNYIYRFPHFRPNQIDGIVQTLEHSDSIVLLPTGSGKSLVYQILSFILPGTTLIVDPIVSLIDDQVDNLNRIGIDRVIGITSATDNKDKVQQAITRGQYNMIFVSPERFQIDSFRQCLTSYCTNAPIATCAIDEAHCVSEWGHDFRTSYLNLANTCRKLLRGNDGAPAILALTGTASESVLRDMERDLGISDDLVIRPESFDRKEIQFIVRPATSADKPLALKQILLNDLPQRYKQGAETFYALNRSQTNCGIIFCPFIGGKFGVKSVLKLVRGDGVMAKEYYGQQTERTRTMSDEEWQKTKALHARDFKDNNYPVLVATKSFGMGIDKPNIRFTIHYSLPQSVEEYYQEAGRAGRDHRQSYSYLIVSNDNHNNIQMLLDRNISASQLKEIEKRQSRQDDISRALYFHTQTFTGIDDEIQTAQKVLHMIDNFDKPHTEVIALPQNQDRTSFEKVIYRLSIFNIVRDYTINFANNEFTVDINRVDREAIAQSYGAYVGKYQGDVGFVESHVNDIRTIDEINDRDFIIAAIRILLQDFIYKTIEQSRRNSLANLLDAVTNFKPNSTDKERSQQMRQKILNFLGNTYVDVIRTITDNPGNLRMIYKTIKSVKGSSKRAKLSAEVSRALQSYPFHPGLLLASACLTTNKHSTTSDIKRLFYPIINYGMTQYGLELRDIMEVIVTALNEASIEPSVYADSMIDLLNTFDRPQTEQILLDILPPKYHYVPIVYASSRITSNLITELRKDKL